MSRIPPPPPIPVDLKHDSEFKIKNDSTFDSRDMDINHSLYDLNHFSVKVITSIKSIPQSGPNCGIAALAMIATLTPFELSVDQIFIEARSRKFSNHGEMFSAQNMKTLAEVLFSSWFNIELFSCGLKFKKEYVINNLKEGNIMLIPYDADKDHSPCCKSGHKAHWAVICGILMNNEEVYFLAKHGKSRYLAVWLFERMRESNDNLLEVDPNKNHDSTSFIIPDGGVKAGLASQFLLLKKKDK